MLESHRPVCKKCGGTLLGDGYKSVEHCEFATDPEIDFMASDEGPVYCDFVESDEPKSSNKNQ